MKLVNGFLVASVTALLVACGGGGSSSTTAAAGTTTAITTPDPTAAPTAVLTNTQTDANAIAAEAKAALAASSNASGASFIPMAVQTSALPTAVTQDMSSMVCLAGGSAVVTTNMDLNAAAPTNGGTLTMTFTNCSPVAGAAISGSVITTYSSVVDGLNFKMTMSFSNMTVSGSALPSPVTVSGGASCNVSGGMPSCFYSDGTRSWASGGSSTGGVASGSYAASYNGGTVNGQLSNFGQAGGTATFTFANGDTAVVTYIDGTNYTVDITVGGTTTTYNVTV